MTIIHMDHNWILLQRKDSFTTELLIIEEYLDYPQIITTGIIK